MKYSVQVIGALILVVINDAYSRPNAGYHYNNALRPQIQRVLAEHREVDAKPVEALPYYGGAKGKYLIIHPSGRTLIVDRNSELVGLRDEDSEDGSVGEASESESTSETGAGPGTDGVEINPPPENASVAEAKPVGLAIAGVGGVASSKPVGTAVVGPGGLAIANPRATAIAGVPGAEQLIGIGGKKKISLQDVNSTSLLKSKNINFDEKSGRNAAGNDAGRQPQGPPQEFSMVGNSASDFSSLPRVIYYPITLY